MEPSRSIVGRMGAGKKTAVFQKTPKFETRREDIYRRPTEGHKKNGPNVRSPAQPTGTEWNEPRSPMRRSLNLVSQTLPWAKVERIAMNPRRKPYPDPNPNPNPNPNPRRKPTGERRQGREHSKGNKVAPSSQRVWGPGGRQSVMPRRMFCTAA